MRFRTLVIYITTHANYSVCLKHVYNIARSNWSNWDLKVLVFVKRGKSLEIGRELTTWMAEGRFGEAFLHELIVGLI